MANGAINFKNNSGNIVSFISGSGSDIIMSGGTLDLSGMTGLTLGNLTMSGTTQNAVSTSHAASYLLTSSFNSYTGTTNTIIGSLQTSTGSLNTYTSSNNSKLEIIESTTSSLNTFTSSANGRLNSIEGKTGSYATTGSNTFNGNLTVTGYIDAQELRTTYISSSILYRSGSTKFGDELTDTHAFTGSMLLSGSLNGVGVFATSGTGLNASVRINNTTSSTGKDWHLYSLNNGNFGLYNNTDGSYAYILTPSGNVGLGTTPSAWNTTSKALQLPQFVSLSHQHNGDLNLMSFALETSANTFTYADTGVFPARLNMNPNNGSITFFGAGTGTAGNTISWSTRFLISSTGNVGIGTSSPASRLNIVGGTSNAGSTTTSDYSVVIQDPTSMVAGVGGSILLQGYKTSTSAIGNFAYVVGKKENGTAGNEAGYLALGTFDSAGIGFERMRIDSSGTVQVKSGNELRVYRSDNARYGTFYTDNLAVHIAASTDPIRISSPERTEFYTAGVERMRITSTGRVMIGGSSGTLDPVWQGMSVHGVNGSNKVIIGYLSSATNGAVIGSHASNLDAWADLNYAANNHLFRAQQAIVMQITSGGDVLLGASSFPAGERMMIQKTEAAPLGLDRRGSDGGVLRFYHDGAEEGNVTVAGTTVSYNGGHLSRYSQTSTNTIIEGLVKGTVMSNLDQMAVWINPETDEPYPNEQLNCMKISDIEGDPNVAGVFVNWDNDGQTSTNDMNIAMTGDMIIRIAQGITVQRGNLLISAGDGTAKPQDDGIIRNSTIAKVTSTHVTCTYEDGSYCVPCVLMAC
jgi:hypothetical protein